MHRLPLYQGKSLFVPSLTAVQLAGLCVRRCLAPATRNGRRSLSDPTPSACWRNRTFPGRRTSCRSVTVAWPPLPLAFCAARQWLWPRTSPRLQLQVWKSRSAAMLISVTLASTLHRNGIRFSM